MIKTRGLSHVALSVADPDRSLAFYQSVFGVREYFRNESTIQVLGPGPFDIAFEKRPAVTAVERAGGIVTSRGQFAPGLPYAFVRDPDGYEIEIWFE
jgi:catechol 2,3-dioxygenase-like lactoylglutathione lyase family enzyme